VPICGKKPNKHLRMIPDLTIKRHAARKCSSDSFSAVQEPRDQIKQNSEHNREQDRRRQRDEASEATTLDADIPRETPQGQVCPRRQVRQTAQDDQHNSGKDKEASNIHLPSLLLID